MDDLFDAWIPINSSVVRHGRDIEAILLFDNEGTPGAPYIHSDYITHWKDGVSERARKSCQLGKHVPLPDQVIGLVHGPYVVAREVGNNPKTSAWYILSCPLCGHEVHRHRRELYRQRNSRCANCRGTGVPRKDHHDQP
jgi:hypothetical protein